MSPELSLYLIWFFWAFSWFAAALWTSHAVKSGGFRRQLPSRAVTLLGIILLFGILSPRHMAMTQVWRLDSRWLWMLDGVIVLGFAFAWWARLHLGRLWSANITRKDAHHVVESGPYALVRHPIYTGILVAAFATAILQGTLVALVGAGMMALGWYLKARVEEQFLREELGEESYAAYSARVGMLIPFVRF